MGENENKKERLGKGVDMFRKGGTEEKREKWSTLTTQVTRDADHTGHTDHTGYTGYTDPIGHTDHTGDTDRTGDTNHTGHTGHIGHPDHTAWHRSQDLQ